VIDACFFAGIIGFFVATIYGMIAGLLIGLVLVLIYRSKLPEDNIISETWHSLWN